MEFVNKVPFYGATVACADDANLRDLSASHAALGDVRSGPPTLTSWRLTWSWARSEDAASSIAVRRWNRNARPARTRSPWQHNLQNALAAVAVGERIGLDFDRVAAALASFHGAERRFERHGEVERCGGGRRLRPSPDRDRGSSGCCASDIEQAARDRVSAASLLSNGTPDGRVWPALREADEIVLSDIYAAGEEPIADVTVERLAEAIRTGSVARFIWRERSMTSSLRCCASRGREMWWSRLALVRSARCRNG